VLRTIGDASIAEDVVSEVFLDVWRQAASFKARAQILTRLLAIARNKAMSVLRRSSDSQLDDEAALIPTVNPEIVIQKQEKDCNLARKPEATVVKPSRDHRSRLLPPENDRRNFQDHRYSQQHGQSTDISRA
jgi:DNA-directed RNA polymerase specialized sigma24 family protein